MRSRKAQVTPVLWCKRNTGPQQGNSRGSRPVYGLAYSPHWRHLSVRPGWNNVISEAAARSCMGRWMGNELMVGSVFRKRWKRQRRDNAVRPCQGPTLRLEEH